MNDTFTAQQLREEIINIISDIDAQHDDMAEELEKKDFGYPAMVVKDAGDAEARPFRDALEIVTDIIEEWKRELAALPTEPKPASLTENSISFDISDAGKVAIYEDGLHITEYDFLGMYGDATKRHAQSHPGIFRACPKCLKWVNERAMWHGYEAARREIEAYAAMRVEVSR